MPLPAACCCACGSGLPRSGQLLLEPRPDTVPRRLSRMVTRARLLPWCCRSPSAARPSWSSLRTCCGGRVADRAASRDTFLLTLSRRPRSRLTIDHAAYVEFHAERAAYHLVIEFVPDTRIAVETGDFDTVVKFVAQYVSDRLSDPVITEAAS